MSEFVTLPSARVTSIATHQKKYYAVVGQFHNRRWSKRTFKTATLAEAYARRWCDRLNRQAMLAQAQEESQDDA